MNLVIFGPQGSGKGAQAEKISEKYDLQHIETGRIFREIAQKNTQLGKKIRGFINEKKGMVPDDITVNVLEHYLEKISTKKDIILDSAPRTMEQIESVEKILKKFGKSLDKAIYIMLPYEESVRRISKRYICPMCHKRFVLGKDIKSKKDLCPICGGPIRQRKDDTPKGIAKRLKIFYGTTIPVIDHYMREGMLVEIDGNQDMEKVFKDITKALEKK